MVTFWISRYCVFLLVRIWLRIEQSELLLGAALFNTFRNSCFGSEGRPAVILACEDAP